MVGSIITTKKEGESVARGEEFGYFAFGQYFSGLIPRLLKVSDIPHNVKQEDRPSYCYLRKELSSLMKICS